MPFWLTGYPISGPSVPFSPTYRRKRGRGVMGDEGKRRFEAFAKEHSFGGVEPDGSPPRGGLFRKKAVLPGPGVDTLNPPKGSEVTFVRLEGRARGSSLDRGALSRRPEDSSRHPDRGRRRASDTRGNDEEERGRRDTRGREPRDRRPKDDRRLARPAGREAEEPYRPRRDRQDEPSDRKKDTKRTLENEPQENKPEGRDAGRENPVRNRNSSERSRSSQPAEKDRGKQSMSAKPSFSSPGRAQTPEIKSEEEKRRSYNPFHPSKVGYVDKAQVFNKQAEVPSDYYSGYYESGEEEAPEADWEEKVDHQHFKKRALEPLWPVAPSEVVVPKEPRPRGGGSHGGAKEKEEATMAEYDSRSMQIYLDLELRGVDMKVSEILKPLKEESWTEAFQSMVRPKKAATGMRYVRLMENFMDWVKRHEEANGGTLVNPVGRDLVWLYLYVNFMTSQRNPWGR